MTAGILIIPTTSIIIVTTIWLTQIRVFTAGRAGRLQAVLSVAALETIMPVMERPVGSLVELHMVVKRCKAGTHLMEQRLHYEETQFTAIRPMAMLPAPMQPITMLPAPMQPIAMLPAPMQPIAMLPGVRRIVLEPGLRVTHSTGRHVLADTQQVTRSERVLLAGRLSGLRYTAQ